MKSLSLGNCLLGLAVLSMLLAGCGQAEPLPPVTKLDVEFVPGGGGFQRLDVYLPGGRTEPLPTLLMIHGGSFRARTKGIYASLAEHLTGLGYAVVSTNYRYSSNASYPAQVEDVFCALAWIHGNNEEYGFDTQRIFAWGGSAGAYLAAMIGTVDDPAPYLADCPNDLPPQDWVAGTIAFYGFFDFLHVEDFPGYPELPALRGYWGAPYEALSLEILREMSPQSWIDGSEQPFLLLHGTEDREMPSIMSERFAQALESAGVEVELVLIGAGHAFELKPIESPEMTQAMEAVTAFLEDNGG